MERFIMKRMTEKFDHTEKEAVELKEKQLEQVAGGAGPDYDSSHVHGRPAAKGDLVTETDAIDDELRQRPVL